MWRYSGATLAFALAIALLAGSVCGPACSGALCLSKSATRDAKTKCHGMAAQPSNDSLSMAARLQNCSLPSANVATLTKPVAPKNAEGRASNSIIFATSDDLQITSGSKINLSLHSKDSPPSLPATIISAVVLRV